jgi:hypothetical protein
LDVLFEYLKMHGTTNSKKENLVNKETEEEGSW